MTTQTFKVYADVKLNDRGDVVDIANITQLSGDKVLPDYIYVSVTLPSAYAEQPVFNAIKGSITGRDPITNVGVYKLFPSNRNSGNNGLYYVKVYTNDLGPSVFLMYNGTFWVFYIQTPNMLKDIMSIKLFPKSNLIGGHTKIKYIDNSARIVSNSQLMINITNSMPEAIAVDGLVIGRGENSEGFRRLMGADTQELYK